MSLTTYQEAIQRAAVAIVQERKRLNDAFAGLELALQAMHPTATIAEDGVVWVTQYEGHAPAQEGAEPAQEAASAPPATTPPPAPAAPPKATNGHKEKRTINAPPWWSRSQIIEAEQFSYQVWTVLNSQGPMVASEVAGVLDSTKQRVGDAFRTLRDRDCIAESGKRRPHGVHVGRLSDEYRTSRAWVDRDGNEHDHSPAFGHVVDPQMAGAAT